MFERMMVPVDLAHVETLRPALQVASDLAKHYSCEVHYVSVTATVPGSVARTPAEYQDKLEAFARQQSESHGQPVHARVITSPDPVADLDGVLTQAIDDIGAELVVMATHLPKHLDAIMPAHGGEIATRTPASVFLVRP